jgi:hypothetical protein
LYEYTVTLLLSTVHNKKTQKKYVTAQRVDKVADKKGRVLLYEVGTFGPKKKGVQVFGGAPKKGGARASGYLIKPDIQCSPCPKK